MSEIKRRGGHRALVKTIIGEVNDLLSNPTADSMKFKQRLKTLVNQKEKIEALDEEIQVNLEEKTLYQDMQEALRVTTEIEDLICVVEEKIKTLSSADNVATGTIKGITKLPTLQLPNFDGNPVNWMHFWDTFRSAVHDRNDITGANKFSYLIGQLEGEAKQLLEGFTVTNRHYNEAIKLMEETYGKPTKIIQAHVNALLDLNAPKASAKELSKFRASYECHLRALKTLNVNIEESGVILSIILIRKLPSKVKDNITRAGSADLWTLDTFRAAINKEIEMLQVAEPEEKLSKTTYEAVKPNNVEEIQKVKSTAGSFNITAGATRKVCKFCFSDGHREAECKKYCKADSRRERAKELNLCYNCLYDNHRVRDCRSNYHCKYCRGWHHYLICVKETKSATKKVEEKASTATVSSVCGSGQAVTGVALPTAILPLKRKTKETIFLRALFDQGSQKTFILDSTVQGLKLETKGKINLCIDGFQSVGKLQEYKLARFEVTTRSGRIDVEAVVVKTLPARVEVPGMTKAIESLLEKGICLADPMVNTDVITDVSVLIGADQFYNFVSGQDRVGKINIINSTLGVMMSGPLPREDCNGSTMNAQIISVLKVNVAECTEGDIEKIWALDSVGIESSGKNEGEFTDDFFKKIKYHNGQYTVELPWKENHEFLPSNYGLARGRLTATLKQLRKVPNQIEIYDKIIKDQLQRNFIEEVEFDGFEGKTKVHYLSHHCVVKKDSTTTPIRIVYDCSAGKISLNKCLHTGPSLVQELGKIILRFRLGTYACVSDIAKAYLMVGLHEKDRDATRFLWVEDPQDEKVKIKVYRFRVVLFGATCSQYLLGATIRYHLKLHDSLVAGNLSRNIYIDNVQGTFQSEENIIKFYREGKDLMEKGGFTLREWATNSPRLQKEIDENGDGAKLKEGKVVKVLGLQWNTSSDCIGFPTHDFHIPPEQFTKRNIVSKAAKIFDPIGMIAPVSVASRIFIQDIWKGKYTWDEVISSDKLFKLWEKIAVNSRKALEFQIPRSIDMEGKLQLHAFSDASSRAYGAVLYISNGKKCQFVLSKAKVAPLRELTIPKLELTAAMIAVRLVSYVVSAYSEELKFDSIFVWIDSQIALHWITGEKPLTAFVQNKVNDIRMLCGQAKFRYIPTQDNPADFLSRSMSAEDLKNSLLWHHGPDWILDESEWPANDWSNCKSEEISRAYIVNNIIERNKEYVIDMGRYSSLRKLLHITVLVLRFIKLLKGNGGKCKILNHNINVTEWKEAEVLWIKQVQDEHFTTELKYLYNCKEKASNLVVQLNLFLQDGIVHCKGRLQHADVADSSKDPILLPSRCHFTNLIIHDAHFRIFHGGTTAVMCYVRRRFWVPCLRQRVKLLIRSCVTCRRIHGNHYKTPNPPPLPITRVTESRPFTVTGVDYSGALIVRDRQLERKVYICLFTCAVTRAVHLEMVNDNSCESFLLAFRRFISRRSVPTLMMSDNSTTFVSSANFLQSFQLDEHVRANLINNHCEWKFIPSRAPWFGGYWERLIAIVKNSIKKVLGRAFVSIEEMRTLIVEVEGIVNDRPVTFVSDNLEDYQALSPSQLLYGHRVGGLPDVIDIEEFNDDFITPNLLSVRQKRCEKLRKQFWNRWRSDYLLSLRERQSEQMKKLPPDKQKQAVKVNDIVLVHDEGPRLTWKLGKILEIYISEDGYIRSALVKTSKANITRPLKKLFPLEVGFQNKEFIIPRDDSDGKVPVRRVPKRAAAIQATDAIRFQLKS